MDWRIVLIPIALFVLGICYMVFMNVRGKNSAGVAQNVMKDFVREQLPPVQSAVNTINLLEDAVNAQHIWVVAYNQDGMHMIPAKSNPMTQTICRYEDETPMFNIHKQLAANILTGNKSETIDYIPCSAITEVVIDESKKKVQLEVGGTHLKLKYQSKDCFGADQEREVAAFLRYLREIQERLNKVANA